MLALSSRVSLKRVILALVILLSPHILTSPSNQQYYSVVAAQQQQRDTLDTDSDIDEEKLRKKQEKQERKRQREQKNIIRNIIKASKNGEYYKVLGLKFWEVKVMGGKKYIPIINPKTKDIKRAYRKQARYVHPDKNRSSTRGGDENEIDEYTLIEAFDALDKASAILMDEQLRQDYIEQLRSHKNQIQEQRRAFRKHILDTVTGNLGNFVNMTRRIFGPFFTPIVVLGVLIFL